MTFCLQSEVTKYGQYDVPEPHKCVALNVGQPSNSHLPLKEYNDALVKIAQNNNPASLQYGKISGYDNFRKDFANFLSNVYTNDYKKFAEKNCIEKISINVNEKNLIMTNGNTGGLLLLLYLYASTNTTIFVEDPTYFLALDIFRDLKLNIVPIKIDNHGLIVSELGEQLKLEDPTKTCILYTIPINQNPTGYTLSEGRRMQLASLASLYPNFYVFADEVYHMLNFSDYVDVFPMCYYHKNFISMGSFSKIFAPALRLGWIQSMNDDVINKLLGCGQLDSSGCINPMGCVITHQLIKDNSLINVINNWRTFLRNNCKSLYGALITVLSEHIEDVEYPKGGYFLWVKFKNYVDMVKLSEIMEKYGVKFHHGNKFSSSKNAGNYARLSFSWYSDKDYETGVHNLKSLIENECNKNIQKISVYVLGHKGRLGSLIVNKLNTSENLEFKGGLSRDMNLECINNSSVIVDVSSPEGTTQLLTKLLESKIYCPVIIGTTGILPIELIKDYSQHAPISVASNFSKGINQFKEIINMIDKDNWVASLSETHHVNKKDAPSGTAKLLAKTYGIDLIPYDSIESIRTGEVFGEHHLTLKNDNNLIKISHVAKSRELFADGSLEWINQTINKIPGIYENLSNGMKRSTSSMFMDHTLSEEFSQFTKLVSVIDKNKWIPKIVEISTDKIYDIIFDGDNEYIQIKYVGNI